MADYKIRILWIYRSCSLKNQVIIAVKISLNLAVRIIYAVDYSFYSVCVIVVNFHISVC